MILEKKLTGNFVKLESVTPDDTEFILSLRLDDNMNKFLNKVDDDIEKQKKWIIAQQERIGDYYFIVTDKNNNKLGTISLYNIVNDEAEFGRWISRGNSLENLESVMLLHDFAFQELDLKRVYSRTVEDNKKVVKFHKRFGAEFTKTLTSEDNNFILAEHEIKKTNYDKIREKNYNTLEAFINHKEEA